MLYQRNSQIVMPYKQDLDIDSKSSSLIGHHFYCLDMRVCVDQNWISKRRNTMNNIIKSTLALGLVVTTAVLSTLPAEAEIHSRSKELVVMEARDLPEQAQAPGNSLFLHSDNAGSTYLYVEQNQGTRLSVFDVTDPARIKLVVSTPLAAEGAFDFVRPLGDYAELVCFRHSQREAVLDLRKTKRPVLRVISTVTDLGRAEALGESGFLVTSQARKYIPAVARDYQVIDVAASIPTELASVNDVKHRVTNDETGTTFLLGSNGLTVVRRLSIENDYKERQWQTQGN
jgi:hypothetical protein